MILFCAVVVPPLRLQAQTLHAFRLSVFLNGVLLVSVVGVGAFGLAFVVSRKVAVGVRTAAIAVFAVFWWSLVGMVLDGVIGAAGSGAAQSGFGSGDFSLGAVMLPMVFIGLGYAMARHGGIWAIALSALVLFVLTAAGYGSLISRVEIAAQARGSVVTSVGMPETRPNLLVILLDGKPRSDVQAELFAVDDEPFRRELADLGFETNLHAWANASVTYASLASMFALDTVVTDTTSADAAWPQVRGVTGGDGEFFRAFKAAGYSIGMSPPGWSGSRCDSIVDRCELFRQTQSNLYWLMRGSAIGGLFPNDLIRFPWIDIGDAQIDNVTSMHLRGIEANRLEPTLTWIHTDLPHPPVVFSRDCSFQSDGWRNSFALSDGTVDSQRRAAAMGEQIECVDARVLDQVRSVIANDPSVAILIVSDHGSDSLPHGHKVGALHEARLWERMAVFSSFRGPPRCDGVAVQPTVVDTFREVTRCLLDAEVSRDPVGTFVVPGEVQLARAEPVYEVHPRVP